MDNIAKLLKNAQYGLELYSTIFGIVYLKGVNDNLTIAVYDKNKIARYFNKYGQYFDGFSDAECQLFPAKGMSWDKWEQAVHPKFKIGDWIILNDGSSDVPVQIYNLKKDRYLVTNMLGSKGEVMLTCQDKWRLWSINDAKPGDILNANGAVFIYKKHNKDYVYHYCGINLVYEFVIDTDDSVWNINNKIYPATQEQKDLLFNKIKEAGYTWDLNSNTLYSNTLTKKTKFKIGDWITDGICKAKIIDIDNKYYWYSKNCMLGEIESIDKIYHIWTIDDAKPGDILSYKDEISIYKNSIMDFLDKFAGFQYYCCYDGKVLVTDGFYSLTEKKDKFDIYPATEKQIETLFSYMTPAGYIWDFNNKALKETKFKIGNWIVNNEDKNVSQITEIICDEKDPNILYGYVHTNGFFANTFEDNYHLWTIKDAKKGDILSAKIDGDDYILLFKQIKDGWIETYGHYYITIDKFCVPTQLFCRDYQGTLHPATQEQCKTLFKKMRVDGYKWDPDKKVLTNRNKPHYDIANFHAGMPVLVRILDKHKWCYLLFSHCYKHQGILHFHAGGAGWLQCIPFNKDTEHLLGTNDMCSEEYINWRNKR